MKFIGILLLIILAINCFALSAHQSFDSSSQMECPLEIDNSQENESDEASEELEKTFIVYDLYQINLISQLTAGIPFKLSSYSYSYIQPLFRPPNF